MTDREPSARTSDIETAGDEASSADLKAARTEEVLQRQAFYDEAAPVTRFLCVRSGSGVYLVNTHDKHIGRSLFAKQGRGEIQVLRRAVDILEALYGDDAVTDKTFVDVGANIGTTTVPAMLEYSFDRAIAIEPEEENFLTLRLNTVLNQIDDRTLVLCKAASDRIGSSELVVNREQGGKHWIATDESKKKRVRKADEIVSVETITLDQLAEDGLLNPDSTGLLWIDAQAHEGQIIAGAGALTSRGVPIVLEWDPAALDRTGDRSTIQAIAQRDYTHFAGMRADQIDDGPKYWLRPVAELDDYAQRFLDPSRSEKFTDIMLLRLTGVEVPTDRMEDQIDLHTVVKRHRMLAQQSSEQGPKPVKLLRRLGRRLKAGGRRREGGER